MSTSLKSFRSLTTRSAILAVAVVDGVVASSLGSADPANATQWKAVGTSSKLTAFDPKPNSISCGL